MQKQSSPDAADETNRILLVDDDATNLDVLRQTLEGHGYRLFFARSGEDAIKIARRAHPGLILLDVVMSGIDGYETCRLLKQDPETRDAAVIFLSALDDAKDKVRGFEAGAVDFVTKPFQGDEVLARVHTHLSIQRLLRRQPEAGAPTAAHVGRDDQTGLHVDDDLQSATDSNGPSAATDVAASRRSVFRTGEVVAFRFRIVSYLARGGMGELYEAEDLELHERVALKTILSNIADDERSILLFKREVHLARQVTHANVCRIFDVFRHRPAGDRGRAGEVVFLAMELLHGETLADRLARDGRLPTADVLPIMRQMAAGLAAAHRAGVVHRDFKSHNVMLVEPTPPDRDPRAVITDFGLARRSTHDDRTSMALLTDTPEISGTPAYMAPEQVEGGAVTPATDIYAFGVVLFEMVTGTWPFMAETPLRTAVKRLQEPPPSPRTHVPDLDPVWEETILRCLARAPADRFATIGDVAVALEGRLRDDRVADDRARRRSPTAWVLALVLSATLAGGYFIYARFVQASAADGITSLAVLPFVNTSRDPQQEYLSDGISESLINRLSQLPGLKVVANSSSSRYKGKNTDPQDVAQALGVDGVLAGKVLQRGDSISISVELIDGRDRTLMWGEQYVRPATDLLQVQGDISREIAAKLRLRLTQGQQQRLATPDVRSPEAYELLLKGRFHRAKGSADDRRRAGDYFARAIAVDAGYALAHADLSDIYRSLVNSSLVDPAEYLPKARAAARRALELDENLAEAHYALANLMTYAWEWTDAEREYQRAIALNPNLALAHRWYASYLGLVGRHDEAIAEIMRARELDPLSPGVNATVGSILATARRYEQAIAALQKTIELDPSYPYSYAFLGSTYAAQRRYANAVAAYQKAITLGLDTSTTQIALGAAYAGAGDDTRARAVLARLQSQTEYVSPGELAILLAALGEREEAFASLEKAHAARDLQLQYLGTNAGYDPLRADPRFRDLLKRVGLAP
jgi:eukaryotic-like serine/threonine-protein kinase